MKETKEIKLYNVIFPVWFLLIFPPIWLIIIPLNLIIDSIIVYICMKKNNVNDIKEKLKKIIFKVVCFGFLADIIGGIFMYASVFLEIFVEDSKWLVDNLINPVMFNPFSSVFGLIYTILAMMISSILIYIFNYKYTFNKIELDDKIKKRISLVLAIVTTPILFLLPTEWFY